MRTTQEKTCSLFQFLKEAATLRRKRIAAYGAHDKLLWFTDLPRDLPQTWKNACRSAFVTDNPAEIPDLWLEVRKKRRPTFPALPRELQDWVPQEFQGNPDEYVQKSTEELLDLLNLQITVLVEKSVPDANSLSGERRTLTEKVPEVRRLEDYPKVQDAWLGYLMNQWESWAQEMRRWKQVQDLYEDVDFMRRRIEEAEERYELLLAVGLLQWRDSAGCTVKRHLLTAPAEISLDAARGILTVGPAASFEEFRVELDMLELQDRPRLEGGDLESRLEELDVRAWDKASVGEILRIIANKASADSEVGEEWTPLDRADDTFRVLYAPALVLRERRPTAYEELISRFLEASAAESAFSTTPPWERFVTEAEPSRHAADGSYDAGLQLDDVEGRLYFPLPTNDEQREIAERLRTRPYVLVKGPPGTGKSHTIANLICHLLATGKRVLVAAHAPKALTVLRDLLPGDIRNLCVTALGSTREDHRLLEDSVRGILSRKNEWKGEQWARGEIDRLEKELRQLEGESAKVDRQLREYREAETHSHTLPGGYQGTAAQIARQVERERQTYGWFPELPGDQSRCPLSREDVAFLADFHAALTEERLTELNLGIGTFALPDRSELAEAIERLNAAEGAAKTALAEVPSAQLDEVRQFSDRDLEAGRAFLNELEEHATRAGRLLGELTREILKDLLVGQDARWNRLGREVGGLVEKILAARERAGTGKIDVPSDIEGAKLLADGQRRLGHLRKGGRRGLGVLAPRVMRETRYIEERCRVNGEPPRDQKSLEMLLGFLELTELIQRFYTLWPTATDLGPGDPVRAADEVSDLSQELCRLLDFFRGCDRGTLDLIPIDRRATLAERDERATWKRSIEAERAARRARKARAPLEAWRDAIRSLAHERPHPCMAELDHAIEGRDPLRWSAAWRTRENLRLASDRLHRYHELLDNVRGVCPALASVLQSTQGNPNWKQRVAALEEAWNWALAKVWLRRVTNTKDYEQLVRRRERLQDNVEKKIEELTALKAWREFFLRLNDRTEQSLTDAPLIPLRQPPPNRLPPLKANFVEQGSCEGENERIRNLPEAEAIVATIEACLADEAYEGKTMGVIVLQGHAQAELIERKLAETLEPKVREQRKLRCGVPATFQGDQRDVIFLSLVIAPNRLFRAVTGLPYQRRFNVAMSRARDQVWLFHSVQRHDLSPQDLRRRLLNFFYSPGQGALEGIYEELDRLEREARRSQRQPGEQPDPYESWFEVDVALELLRRGYRIRPQVEVASYRLDLVVEGLTNRLAVECDGEAWHGPERFDRDTARQRQLERVDWKFVRIRESEFYADRESAVRRIIDSCEELSIRPLGEEEREIQEESTAPASVGEGWSLEDEEEEERGGHREADREVPKEIGEDLSLSLFTGYSEESGFPNPRDASPANVRAALRRIIEKEGPLTKRFLIRLYVEGCPDLHRAGKTVRSLLNRGLYSMQRAGEIIVEDELGDRSLESQVIRLTGSPRVRERPAGRRDLLDIPPSELFLVLDRLSESVTGSTHNNEVLARRLLEHYEFKRLTQVRKKHLEKILGIYRRVPLGSGMRVRDEYAE